MAKLYKEMSGSGGHWYTLDGQPRHFIQGKTGESRPTTLRDARKMLLVPSVTGIIGVLNKPALSDWRLRTVAEKAAEIELKGEVTDAVFKDLKDQAFAQVTTAADLGSRLHATLEHLLLTGEEPVGEMAEYLAPVVGFLDTVQIAPTSVEKILVNTKHGFAGTVDLLFTWGDGKVGILDWKTRRTREGQKVRAYDGQDLQLAAYAATAYGEDRIDECIAANVVISTTEPGRMEVLRHENLGAAWSAFQACCAIWRHLKKYDPRLADNG